MYIKIQPYVYNFDVHTDSNNANFFVEVWAI